MGTNPFTMQRRNKKTLRKLRRVRISHRCCGDRPIKQSSCAPVNGAAAAPTKCNSPVPTPLLLLLLLLAVVVGSADPLPERDRRPLPVPVSVAAEVVV